MVYLIKCFAEVHDYGISRAFIVYSVIEVLCKLNQLSFTANSTSEAMLVVKEEVGFIKMGHYVR